MTAASAALVLREVSFGYVSREVGHGQLILRDFSITIVSGRITALMGTSGCGKSTIAKLAAGIIEPNAGQISRDPEFVRKCDIVYVDQAPMNSVFPWLNVQANITEPLRQLGWSEAEMAARVEFVKETFRLQHVRDAMPKELSGGELQRLALARSLSWSPKAVILDETLSSLDPPTRKLILEAMHRIVREDHSTIVLITHYPQDALDLADRIVVLGGRPVSILDDCVIDLPFPRPFNSPAYDDFELRLGRTIRSVNEQMKFS